MWTSWTLGHKLRALDAMSNLGLWIIWMTWDPLSWGLKCYEQLRAVDEMKNSWSWAYDSKCYEYLKAMDDMNDSMS